MERPERLGHVLEMLKCKDAVLRQLSMYLASRVAEPTLLSGAGSVADPPYTTAGHASVSAGVQVYEDQHHPIETVSAIEAITFAMEQNGYRQTDLAQLLGSRSRAAEILNGKRKLNLR